MVEGRVFSALSQFHIPSTKKLRKAKSASDLSVVTDDSSILAFNMPICDNRASISLKSSLLPPVKARVKLPSSYQKGVEHQHQVPIKINGKDVESLSEQALKTELGKRNLHISGKTKQVLLEARLKDAIQNFRQTAMALMMQMTG